MYLDLLIKSIKNPKKFLFVLNKKLFSIPDLNSLNKIQNKFIKKNIFTYGLILQKKILNLINYFFEEIKKKKIKFELNMVDKLDENIFKSFKLLMV